MIIVSQDKMQIVNFENINNITIEWLRIFSYSNNYNGKDETKALLGQYKTIERAKEVLKMIVSAYQSCKLFQCTNNDAQEEMAKKYQEFSMTPFKFEMPKE